MSFPNKEDPIQFIVFGMNEASEKKRIYPCHLMEIGNFCAALDRAGVPAETRWRALIRFMRGVKDYLPVNDAERVAMQNHMIELLREKIFSDAAYTQAVQACTAILMRPYEKELQSATEEISKLVDSFYTTIKGRHSDVTEFKEIAIATVTSGSPLNIVVEKLRAGFDTLKDAMQSDIDRLYTLSYMDALSGVPNRRAFDEAYAKAFAEKEATGTPLTLILIDIDHFKNFNDTYGHRIGDQAIRAVAKKLEKTLARYAPYRKELLLSRYGGEEFAILCTGEAAPIAPVVAKACRADMEAYSFVIRDTNGHIHKESVQITISLGVALIQEGFTGAMLLDAADSALYRAKQSGRNRVEIANQDDALKGAVHHMLKSE